MSNSAAGRRRRVWRPILALLIMVHVGLGAHCAFRSTVTHDEYWHVPAGLAVWRSGRFDADNLNPPLSRAWSALPLAILGVGLGEPAVAGDNTALGDHFLAENIDRYHEFAAYARLMNLAWSVLTGLVIALWGRELFGESAGLVGAAVWYLCPVVLSNAALATPDLCATFLFVATSHAAWRFGQNPTWRSTAGLGLLLGLAQLAKYTCVILYPIVAVIWFVARFRGECAKIAVWRAAGQWLAVLASSVVVLNAGYLFQGTGRPLNTYRLASASLKSVVAAVPPIGRFWLPAPADYVAGFDRQRSIMESGHPVYLDGRWSLDTGFRDYYVRACAYKWPHAIQALVLTALAASVLSRRGRGLWRAHAALLIPAAFLAAIASASHMQLGIRYILPAFPLIYLFAGHVGSWLIGPKWNWRRLWVCACLAALPVGLRHHPHHLAYFNELSGGPLEGANHLLDSNIDWGQDLRELQEYLRAQGVESVGLAYFGMVPPARLGIRYHLPPSYREVRASQSLPAGWFAVSVNFVHGRPHTIRDADDRIRASGMDEFGYFRLLDPVARIGWSIHVYKIDDPR